MMIFKRTNISIVLLFISLCGFGQQWLWSRHFKTAQPSIVAGLELDVNDNVYVTGQFKASINIGAPSNISPKANTDFFLSKYNSNNTYQWHVQLGSQGFPSGLVNAKNVVVDPSGNPIVCGFYDQNITFGVSPSIPVYKAGRPASFMGKFNASNGLEVWANRVAWGPDSVKAQWVTCDPDGNIYLTGFSKDTIYFNGATLVGAAGKVQNFIAKFDGNGNFIWATQITYSSATAALNKFVEIHAASNDEIYMGGFFAGTLTVGSVTLNSVTANREDAVLLKFNGSGDVQWGRQAGGIYDDRCNGVATDIFGNVYTTGYITSSAVFDSTGNGTMDSSPLHSNGNEDLMVAKYNKNGQLMWKKANGDAGMDKGYGAFIHENIIMFTGNFAGSVTFNNTTITSPSTSNQDPAFFVYDVDGNPITAKSMAGNDNNDHCELISYDNNGNTYLGGIFTSTKLTVGDSVFTNGTTGKNNAFTAKYHNPFSATFTTINNVSCNGGSNGKLTVTPYFGVGPYSYQWSGNVSSFIDSTASNLSAGIYSVTITDSRDSIAYSTMSVLQGSQITAGFAKTDLNCYQSQDGIINLTVSGGTPSYTYNWTGVTGYNPVTEDQSGLGAGWYKVTITDKVGCSRNDSIEILEPGKIEFGSSIVTPAIPIGSSTGKIDINISGGTPSFSYAWAKDGLTLSGRTSDTLNNLHGGTYQVTVTDSHSCNADTSFLVPDASFLQISKTVTNISCNGLSDGSATVSILNKNPVATYSYQWSNTAVDSTITNVVAGNYKFTITETGGLNRSIIDSAEITEPAALSIASITPVDIKCFGYSTGAVVLSVTGGTLDYSYNWSSGQNTESISLIPAGQYKVTVTDANQCQVNDSATVNQGDSIQFDFTVEQEIRCFGLGTGVIQATLSGGLPPYTYRWDDPGSQSNLIATDLFAGTYHLAVTDGNSCKDTGTFILTQPDEITFSSIDTNNVSCYNYADGSIKVVVQGGETPYDYTWNPDFGNTDSISGLGANITYRLTVTDNKNCTNESFAWVAKRPSAALTLNEKASSHVDVTCFGSATGSSELITTGGWGNNEYTIDGINWQISPVFPSLIANTYVATVRDQGGCHQNDVNIIIDEPNEITAAPPLILNNIIYLSATGGTGVLHYSLDGGPSQSTGQFNNVSDGNHTITVTDANSCQLIVNNIIVTGIETVNDVKYNIFPNPSDGMFSLQLTAPFDKEYYLQVYNTTGALVFENKSIIVGQDGNSIIPIDLTNKGTGVFVVELNGIPLREKLIVQ
jgi:hypothetical protein